MCTHTVVGVSCSVACVGVCVCIGVWVRVWGVHGVWEGVRGVGEKEECL